MQLRGQAACGINQDHVFFARLTGAHRVIADRCRVAALLADDLYGIALGPHRELLARCSAKGIGCSQQHGGALVREAMGQLADGGSLARAIDTGHHHHRGLLGADDQAALQRLEQAGQGIDQQGLELFRCFSFVVFG